MAVRKAGTFKFSPDDRFVEQQNIGNGFVLYFEGLRVRPLVTGLSHTTFIVKDLERSRLFFEKIFDAVELYSSGNDIFSLSREKFPLIKDLWVCIMEGEPLTERTYNHIAFQIAENEFDGYVKRIEAVGAEIKPERNRAAGEGRSVYFYDWDNHLFELHTGTLNERLTRYSKGK